MKKGFFVFGAILLVISGFFFIVILSQMTQMGSMILLFGKQAVQNYQNALVLTGMGTIIGLVLLIYGALATEVKIDKPETEPYEIEPIPHEDAMSKERIPALLEKLDERLVSGEISEATYKELKSKYSEKLRQQERENLEGKIYRKYYGYINYCTSCGREIPSEAELCNYCKNLDKPPQLEE